MLMDDWFKTQHDPLWRDYLDRADKFIIEETGLSRERLEKVLEVLYKYRIIN